MEKNLYTVRTCHRRCHK